MAKYICDRCGADLIGRKVAGAISIVQCQDCQTREFNEGRCFEGRMREMDEIDMYGEECADREDSSVPYVILTDRQMSRRFFKSL